MTRVARCASFGSMASFAHKQGHGAVMERALDSPKLQPLAMELRAIRDGYPLTPDMLSEMVATALDIMRHAERPGTRVNALRLLTIMKGQNDRALRADEEARHHVSNEQINAVRALMASNDPAIRAHMDALRHALANKSAPVDINASTYVPPPALQAEGERGEGALTSPIDPENSVSSAVLADPENLATHATLADK